MNAEHLLAFIWGVALAVVVLVPLEEREPLTPARSAFLVRLFR